MEAKHLTALMLLHSKDLDEARALVSGIFCDHRLVMVDPKDHLDYQHRHVRTPAMSLSVMSYGAEVFIAPQELDSFFLIQLPLKGEDRITSGRDAILSQPGSGTIHSPGQSFSMNWSGACSKLVVRIERDALEWHAATLLGRLPRNPLRFETALDTRGGGGRAWEMTVRKLLRSFQQSPELLDHPLMRAQFEQLVMSGLLVWQANSFSSELWVPEKEVLPKHVRMVEDYMRAHLDAPITNEKLAELTGVSLRTLYNSFKKFRGVSPMRYLKDLRMEKVREELLHAGQLRSVTVIATRWGFFELGRFAAEYKRRFGELPSDTLRRVP